MRLVQHLDQRAAVVDALDDLDAVEHRAGRSVPFSDDENVAGAELVDGAFELRPVLDALATGFLAVDDLNAFGAQRTYLAIEVLMGRTDPAVADLSRRFPLSFRARFFIHRRHKKTGHFRQVASLRKFATV